MATHFNFQNLRGLLSAIPTLSDGQIYLATDTGGVYIGNSGTNVLIGRTIALETNGTPNGDQTKLNLVNGTNITITDDGTGDVTIAGPSALPPSGTAGGDLSGTYPNPSVAKVNGGSVPVSKTIVGTNGSGQIVDATSATLSNNTSGTAANLSGTPALPNGTTATTQTGGDNTTKLATTAFVQAALPTSLPPSGTAGGDLSGTYPNPSVAKVNGGSIPLTKTIVGTNGSGQIIDATSATLSNNTSGTAANLSGTPALPNGTTATKQAALSNDTKIATDSYVDAAVAVETTRAETAEALLAPIASPTFTGTPTAPTQTALTNNTDIATTAYTDAAVAVETSRAETAEATKQATLTGTGIARNGGACTELSGDVTTSGSNAASVVKVNGAAVPVSKIAVGTNSSGQLIDIGSQTQNTFLAAPNGSSGEPTFRAIVAADVPTLNQNTSGTAANLSGTPALPNGTTATTQTAGDNSTKLATTAYVATAAGAYLPLAGGTMTGAIQMTSGLAINWNADAGISRLGGASLAIGNGTAGDRSGILSVGSGTNSAPSISVGAAGSGVYYSSGNGLGFAYNGVFVAGFWSNGTTESELVMPLNTVIGWGANISSSPDTAISRLGAASLAIGNGTAGDYSGSLKLTTIQMAASSGAPTSAGTAGTAGQIIYYSGFAYLCTVTGAAGSATWNKLNMTAV